MALWVDDFPNFPRWDMFPSPGGYILNTICTEMSLATAANLGPFSDPSTFLFSKAVFVRFLTPGPMASQNDNDTFSPGTNSLLAQRKICKIPKGSEKEFASFHDWGGAKLAVSFSPEDCKDGEYRCHVVEIDLYTIHFLAGGFKYFFIFSPRTLGEDSHFDSYSSKGLVQPLTRFWPSKDFERRSCWS